MTTFVLPYPPSTNGLFATIGRKRVKTRAYKDWIEAAGWELRAQAVPLHRGRVRIDYEFGHPPDRRRRDIDNLLKAVNDLLVSCGVIEADDSTVLTGGSFIWRHGFEGARLTVESVE